MWEFVRNLFRKRSEKGSVASYDAPFSAPRVHRIVIPPKPSNLVATSIAPPRSVKSFERKSQCIPSSSARSEEVSVILFGSPIESVKTADTLSTGVRYPTHALFERN